MTVTPTQPIATGTTAQPSILGTPTPESQAISLDNVDLLIEVGRLGKGEIHDVAWAPDGSQLAVRTTIGIYFYDNNLNEQKFIETKYSV